MNSDEILTELENQRERLLVALEPLPDEALTKPDAAGKWSIADILAHLVSWESELVTGLLRIDQGKRPKKLLDAYQDEQLYNDQRFEENRERDLDRIFDDLFRVRRQLEGWIEEFDDRALGDPKRFKWANGRPLWRFIKECSFGHEMEHLADIEAFAARWLAERAGKEGEGT